MRVALRLARRGQGAVEPNPMVGCVLVRGGRLIGSGWHRRFGGPHAEREALRRCAGSPRGATAYVTLEPCCHEGKTPPCTDALIAAGVARVVAAMRDPDSRVSGRGLAQLRRAGIAAEAYAADSPAAEARSVFAEAAALNAPYVKLRRDRRPWVILKWAQSLDGKIATRTGDSQWISGEAARADAHRTRGRVDAIVIGIGTALRDDPLLTARGVRARRVATRIVLDSRLRLPPDAQLVRTAAAAPTWVVGGPDAPASRARRLERAGCRVLRVARGRGGLRLDALLDALGREQVTNVLVEGGGRVLGAFFDAGLADEVHAYVSPRLIGGAGAVSPLHGTGVERVAQTVSLGQAAAMRRVGEDWLLRARLPARS